ncbi:hypothetical protein ACROYT_G010848 [Oculina patagonica]
MKQITNWSCTEPSPMDNLPELTFDEYNNYTWKNLCAGFPQTAEALEANVTKSMCYNYDDPFICVRDPLHCQHRDKSDKRFLKRPKYGEYLYLPKSLWLNVVLHGGVAFLYHPCLSPDIISKLRVMAVSCLHRHVITPYERLTPCKPIAMVAWSCFYSTSQVNVSDAKDWIRKNAMQGPASHVSANGRYNKGLTTPAETVSDKLDTKLCPDKIKSLLNSDDEGESHFRDSIEQDPSENDWMAQGNAESISIQNTEELVIVNERVPSNRKFDTSNAAWALGSVIFLCLVLAGVLLYTRPWKNRDHWWRVEDYNSNTKFSLMKTTGLRWKSRTFPSKKTSGYSRLLSAIPEEFEDDI